MQPTIYKIEFIGNGFLAIMAGMRKTVEKELREREEKKWYQFWK